MPRERPPRGYDRDDFGLPHRFDYYFGLDFSSSTKNRTMLTYLRTSKDSVNPETIEVNPKNANFVVDGGPVVCFDSIVNTIMITKRFVFTKHAHVTDQIPRIKLMTMKILGAHEDSWTPADELTTTDIAALLKITDDSTKEDVTPTFNGTDLNNTGNQPLSNVTMPEAFGDYNLTTDAKLEGVANDFNAIFKAQQYYTNGGKLKTLHRNVETISLSQNKRYHNTYEKRFVPNFVRRGIESLYFGEAIDMPIYSSSRSFHDLAHTATAGNHIFAGADIQFIEWNKKFEQARMG